MISVIQPVNYFAPHTNFVASDQISDYRRRGNGYTHLSSSSWLTSNGGIAPSGPGPQQRATPQNPPPRAVNGRSLSNGYSSVSNNGQPLASTSRPSEVKPRGLVFPPEGQKDYSKSLFVDCSIEYELPNVKIPKYSSPILMIHPNYKQKQQQQQQKQQQQQQKQQQQLHQQQQQQLLMNIKNIKNPSPSKQVNNCVDPKCHCQLKVLKTGMKRSYSNALGNNTVSSQAPRTFYKLPQQQQKNRQQPPPG